MSKSTSIRDIDVNILNNGSRKQSSIRQYASTYNSLCKVLGNYNLYDILEIKDILHKSNINKPQRRNWLMVVYLLYKAIFGEDDKSEIVSRYLDKLISDIKQSRNKNDCTSDNISKYKKLKKLIKSDINNDNIPAVDAVTMYTFTNILSRRGDMRFIRVFHNKGKTSNVYPYINIKTKMMFFPHHKTKREVYISIAKHKSYLKVLSKVKLNGDKLYRDILSSDKTLKHMRNSQKAYSIYIKSIFKKHYNFNVNIQQLRRLDSCLILTPELKKSIEQMKRKAYLQSHSIGTHISDYMKSAD